MKTARDWWREAYRRVRIARREAIKAAQDCMIFGTGVVRIGSDGTPRHVPFAAVAAELKNK